MEELKYLEEQQVSPGLLREVEKFRKEYPVPEKVQSRVVKPPVPFYGKEILEMAIAALLQGENVLLSGSKATGKKYSGGKSCLDFSPAFLQYFL